jgi:hypothetical protein
LARFGGSPVGRTGSGRRRTEKGNAVNKKRGTLRALVTAVANIAREATPSMRVIASETRVTRQSDQNRAAAAHSQK